MSMQTKAEWESVVSYNAETGVFTWLVKPSVGVHVGDRAGSVGGKRRYRAIRYRGKAYKEHRVAWLLVHGEWPEGMIDHANGNPLDNRFENLRIATGSQNNMNKRGWNTLGIKGVFRDRNSFRAAIRVNGATTNLGSFRTIEEAAAAYKAAAIQMHGEFARAA